MALVYPVIDSVTFRATPWRQIKARLAGNGPALTKSRNAEPAPWGGSLRASRPAAIRGVMPLAKGWAIPGEAGLAADRWLAR